MNNKFYALILTPLLFAACNTPEAPAPASTKVEAPVEVQEVVVAEKVETVTTSTDVKYIDKAIVIEQGMVHIDGFMGTLQPTLVNALKDDKTHLTAMGVCSAMAMEMTDSYNAGTTDTKVRRTALKYRNPQNKPDATDTEVMQVLATKSDFKPVAVEMSNHYRVYKPLPTKKPCLICHADSSQMEPQVLKSIKERYPKDLATGFAEGEFRGVIVAEIQK
ncbi:MAG: DUF3365 domain-containing protein [Epsilonproteobacteria bacterium]|nr:DUF3365 domain-containing protein [Campylobacterota bacterium]